MRYSTLILFLLVLLVSSCKKDSIVSEPVNAGKDSTGNARPDTSSEADIRGIVSKGEELMPMQTGNIWQYEESEYQDSNLLVKRKLTLRILDKTNTLYNNELKPLFKFRQIRYFKDWGPDSLFYLLGRDNDTVYWYAHSLHDTNDYFFNKTVYIIDHIQPGAKWYENHGDYSDVFTCKSISDTVTINNVNYICTRIRMGNDRWYEDTYFAKGIGIIQIINTSGWEPNSNLMKRVLVGNILK